MTLDDIFSLLPFWGRNTLRKGSDFQKNKTKLIMKFSDITIDCLLEEQDF